MLSLPTVKFLFARHSVHYVKITIYAHYGCGFSKEDIQFLFLTFKVDDFTRTTLFPYRETAENRTRPLCGRGLIHTLGTAVPASIDPARRMFQLKIFKIYIYILLYNETGPNGRPTIDGDFHSTSREKQYWVLHCFPKLGVQLSQIRLTYFMGTSKVYFDYNLNTICFLFFWVIFLIFVRSFFGAIIGHKIRI